MGRHKKKAVEPDTPMRQKLERQLELDVIMREAAAIVLSDIRKMKDAQVKDDTGKKISATECHRSFQFGEPAGRCSQVSGST
jgi:hypothetical protein